MRRLERATLLQPQLTSRSTARRLLGERSELGLPHLQLGGDAQGRLRMVGTPFQEHAAIFRRLPHRPRAGLLPHLGNPHQRRTRTVGTVCAVTGHDTRGSRGLRTALAGRTLHRTLHRRLGARPRIP